VLKCTAAIRRNLLPPHIKHIQLAHLVNAIEQTLEIGKTHRLCVLHHTIPAKQRALTVRVSLRSLCNTLARDDVHETALLRRFGGILSQFEIIATRHPSG
jgi:hypothetical protein